MSKQPVQKIAVVRCEFNAHVDRVGFKLPEEPWEHKWHPVLDTAATAGITEGSAPAEKGAQFERSGLSQVLRRV